MKEITEDYCDFETAKLLKAKGFNGKCLRTYFGDGKMSRIFDDNDEIYNENLLPNVVAATTLQMAMKWLRKVYNINIEVFYFGDGDPARWAFEIIRLPIGATVFGEYNEKSFEEACKTAIKYVLENLI